jgi:predicted Zn-dependent protease
VRKLDQKHAASLMALAGLLESGDPAKARSFARQAWEATPDDPKCAALEGRWSLKDGFYSQAYQLMKPEAASSKEAALLADFATAAYSIGRIDEARAAMQRVSPESPRSAAAATFLALTAATGPEGLAALEVAAAEALQNEADLVPALMVQASKLNRDGKEQEAIVIYEGILGRLKEFPPVQLNLAVLYAQNPERLAEAEALALDVLEGTGHSSELDRILGEIMVRKGKPEAAIPLLTATEKASGLDAEGLFFLGKAYLSLDPKKVGEGREKLAAALKAGLDGGSADEAKVMLEDAE